MAWAAAPGRAREIRMADEGELVQRILREIQATLQ
jgi:hypothetical protein